MKDINQVELLYRSQPSSKGFISGYLSYLGELLEKMDVDAIAKFIDLLLLARTKGSRVFFIGNGGSASTASHFANDLGIGTRTLHKPFKALSLADNISILTAIGNDYGYQDIFVQQLRVQMQAGDVVVAISASGNSPNIVKAVDFANSLGTTVGVTGFDGGMLKKLATLSLHVPTAAGEYGPVEDIHLVLDHCVSAYLMYHCREAELSSGVAHTDHKTEARGSFSIPAESDH